MIVKIDDKIYNSNDVTISIGLTRYEKLIVKHMKKQNKIVIGPSTLSKEELSILLKELEPYMNVIDRDNENKLRPNGGVE